MTTKKKVPMHAVEQTDERAVALDEALEGARRATGNASSSARRDLCGGQRVTSVPTATRNHRNRILRVNAAPNRLSSSGCSLAILICIAVCETSNTVIGKAYCRSLKNAST